MDNRRQSVLHKLAQTFAVSETSDRKEQTFVAELVALAKRLQQQ